jgi:hypothetical protein
VKAALAHEYGVFNKLFSSVPAVLNFINTHSHKLDVAQATPVLLGVDIDMMCCQDKLRPALGALHQFMMARLFGCAVVHDAQASMPNHLFAQSATSCGLMTNVAGGS